MSALACDTRAVIETPENVLLTFSTAGAGSRLGAYLADLTIRLVVFYGLLWSLAAAAPVLGNAIPTGVILFGLFILEWVYSAGFEAFWRGQTPGKKIFRLRVIKDAGYPISLYDAVLRNLLRAADFLPFGYGVGLICMGATPRLQRIGDLVAGTIVVRDERPRFERNTTAFDKVDPLVPADCPRRFFVSERTLDVIEQLIWRREKLSRRRVDEIASIIAVPLARQLGYPLHEERGIDRHIFFLRRVLRTFSTLNAEGDR